MSMAAVYQEPAAFLEEAFPAKVPDPQVLWLTEDIRTAMKDQLGEAMRALRVRYWRQDGKTAWILQEIGKEEPITAGIVVEDGRIAGVNVLVYRESRGWEIRYPYFREQFLEAELTEDGKLSKPIDGISGATLSVRAMRTIARRALFLHTQLMKDETP